MSDTNYNHLVKGVLARSLHLPAEAACKLCGYYDIWHPEVREILTEAGYSLESAVSTAACQCGTEEEKVARGAELDEIKKQWLGQATRSTIFIEHAKTIKDEDDERERRRRR